MSEFPEPCDRCGHSRLNEEKDFRFGVRVKSHRLYPVSTHLTDSKYEVTITNSSENELLSDRLYFCGHHYAQHEAYIASRGYRVKEWHKAAE